MFVLILFLDLYDDDDQDLDAESDDEPDVVDDDEEMPYTCDEDEDEDFERLFSAFCDEQEKQQGQEFLYIFLFTNNFLKFCY